MFVIINTRLYLYANRILHIAWAWAVDVEVEVERELHTA